MKSHQLFIVININNVKRKITQICFILEIQTVVDPRNKQICDFYLGLKALKVQFTTKLCMNSYTQYIKSAGSCILLNFMTKACRKVGRALDMSALLIWIPSCLFVYLEPH